MPKVSLVVCLYRERQLLERLLQHTSGCYDELVVVHDGMEEGEPEWSPGYPKAEHAIDWSTIPYNGKLPNGFSLGESSGAHGTLREFVHLQGGRFFEHPKIGSLEGQSPFAWWVASNDWILRLDADELPSPDLVRWLQEFRHSPPPLMEVSGFTCVWPPWDGFKETTLDVPEWRPFLFDRHRVTYFALTEQGPIPDNAWNSTGLVLFHRPKRKSYGPSNLLFRRQAYLWRKSIALSLRNTPLHLPRWRWSSPDWPPYWEEIRQRPLTTAIKRGLLSIPREFRQAHRSNQPFLLDAAIGTAMHKMLVPLAYWYYKIKQ